MARQGSKSIYEIIAADTPTCFAPWGTSARDS
jgi:hypothetical protein